MLTHNFKNAIVNNLAIAYVNNHDYVDNSLYFTDMKGVQRRIHCPSRECHVSLCSLFYGSVGVDVTTANRAIKDYDNIKDMITSRNFWLYGGRKFHSTEGDSSNWITGGEMIILGSGDTPPTKDDYKLDSWIPTTELSVESYSGVGPDNEWPPLKMCSLTTVFRNNTEENITVKEVGVCFAIGKQGRVQKYILLIRDVLQNPIMIKPDEITSFTVVIK